MRKSTLPERGFSLVELMVALAIGLVVILAVTQIFVNSEGQRRTTGAGVDAQTAAAIGIYSIERDIGGAGYAINSSNVRGCGTFYSYYDSDGNGPIPGAPVPNLSFFPVRILDGGAGNSDSIVLTSGNTASSGMPTQLADNMAQSHDDIEVSNISGCVPNGFAIISDGAKCTFMQITAIDTVAYKLKHEYKDTSESTYNPSIAYQTDNNWPKYSLGNTAICLSNGVIQRTYGVVNNRLTLSSGGVISDIVPDIVALKAQYGISAVGTSDQVVNWVSATGSWANPTAADRERIKAVRLGIVARSSLPEREDVTGSCTTTGGILNNGPCLWDDTAADPAPSIDLSGDPDWRRYRYKTYSTIVVPRNLMWKPPL